jgi:hypothetical protein
MHTIEVKLYDDIAAALKINVKEKWKITSVSNNLAEV